MKHRLLSLLGCLVIGCAGVPVAQPAAAGPPERAERPSASLVAGPPAPSKCEQVCDGEHYCGFGLATLEGTDPQAAVRTAQQAARDELAKAISVWVTSKMRSVATYDRTAEGSVETESNRIDTLQYVDMGLQGVSVRTEIDDDKNRACAFATLRKQEYQRRVDKDIADNVAVIVDGYRNHEEMLARGDVATAIRSLLGARNVLRDHFRGAPIKGKIAGREQVMHGLIEATLSNILGRLSVEPLEQKVAFGADGQPKRPVLFNVSYRGEAGAVPASNLPVELSFVRGKGTLHAAAKSSNRVGLVEVPVQRIDPSSPETGVRAQVRLAELEESGTRIALPFADVALVKVPAVAFVVTPAASSLDDVAQAVKSMLAQRELELAQAPAGIETIDGPAYDRLVKAGADKVIFVQVSTKGAEATPTDPAFAVATAVVEIHDVRDRRRLSSAAVRGKRAYGASSRAARATATARIHAPLLAAIEQSVQQQLALGKTSP